MLTRAHNIRRYFRLSILATSVALAVVFICLLLHRWYSERIYLRNEYTVQAKLIGNNASVALALNDAYGANRILTLATDLPHIREAALYLPNGKLLAKKSQPAHAEVFGKLQPAYGHTTTASSIRIVLPVTMAEGTPKEKILGTVAVYMSMDNMYRELVRFSLALITSALAAIFLAHLATRHLRQHMARTEAELHRLALFDRVTGLANRHAFELALEQQVQRHLRAGGSSALLFIDVDDFKRVNDVFGHGMGDVVLQGLSARLSHALRNSDIIARIGGDEFGIILVNTKSPNDAARVAKHLVEVASEPFHFDDKYAQIGLSIGISMLPQDGNSSELQMLHADMAMYHAKQNGKNNHQFFSDTLGSMVKDRLEIETALRQAAEQQQLEVVYQPQFRFGSKEPDSLEALVRWNHPERGPMMPAEFIAIAEESGLILDIERTVMHQVCRDISIWRAAGLKVPPIAVNTSARQLTHGKLLEEIIDCLNAHDLAPNDIEIELTESVLMDRIEANQKQLTSFNAAGLRIAVDDFGTGYSSLSYLQRLPLSKLKIDKSFISVLGDKHENTAIVLGIINMAHAINLKVVAEGVETEQQAAILGDCGCDYLQGFLLGKPLGFSETSRILPHTKSTQAGG